MFSKIKTFFQSIGKCSSPNCQNSAIAFGVCKQHIREEWERSRREVENEECQKLIKVFKQAVLELEQEKQQKSATFPIPTR